MSGFKQGISKGVTNTSNGIVTAQLTSSTVAGNLIVVTAISDGTSGNVTSVYDNKGNVYTRIVDFTGDGSSDFSMWYAWNIVGGSSHTVSMAYNLSSASRATIIVQEFSGVITTDDPLDKHMHQAGTSTTPSSSTTATLTQAAELVVGAVSVASTTTFTAGSGYTNAMSNTSGGTYVSAAMESKVVASTTAVSAGWTLGASRYYSANVATFLMSVDHTIAINQVTEADESHSVSNSRPVDPNTRVADAYGVGLFGSPTSVASFWSGHMPIGPRTLVVNQAQETDSLQVITGPLVRVAAVTVPGVITPAAALPHASDVGQYESDDLTAALLADRRTERFRFQLLNSSLTAISFLDDIQVSGSITYDHDSDIKRTAQFTIVETDATAGIKYETDRIKPFYDLLMPDGMWARFPLGVFLLSSPSRSIKSGIVTREIEAFDQTAVLTQDSTADRYTMAIGANVIDTVRDILDDHHLTYLIGDADDKLAVAKDWDPGTSWYQIVADLLAMISFRPLWFDADGLGRTMPNVTPLDRQVDFVYPDDSLSVLDPEAKETLDLWDVPNRWVLIASTPANKPIVSEYTNDNLDSPTSTATRGRTITKVVSDSIDATTQDALDQLAQSMAFEDSQVYQSLEFSTAIMPQHADYDVLRIVYGAFGINGVYAESNWSITMQSGALMTHSARRLIDVRHPIQDDVVLSDTGILHQAGETEVAQPITAVKVKPVTSHTTTWSATYHRTYPGNSTNIGYRSPEPTDLYAGYAQNSYNIQRGIIGFDFAAIQSALSGSTIVSCYFIFKMNHTWWNSGATWYIGTHTYTSKPTNWDGNVHVAKIRRVSLHVVAGTTYTANLGVSVGNDFKTGAALGIAIGPPPSSSLDYYGYQAATPMQLKITYTK